MASHVQLVEREQRPAATRPRASTVQQDSILIVACARFVIHQILSPPTNPNAKRRISAQLGTHASLAMAAGMAAAMAAAMAPGTRPYVALHQTAQRAQQAQSVRAPPNA